MDLIFVLDETAIKKIVSNISKFNICINEYIDIVDSTDHEDSKKYILEEIWEIPITSDKNLADVIFADLFNNSDFRDSSVRLQRLIDTCDYYQATVIHECENYLPVSTFLNDNPKAGLIGYEPYPSFPWWNTIYFDPIKNAHDVSVYCRKLVVIEKVREPMFWKYTDLMFKNLYFNKEKTKWRLFNLSYEEYFSKFIMHLSYLNDEAQNDFNENLEQFIQIASSRGVELSPESPKTHKNKSAMRERDIEINSIVISCEWHTKMDFDRGRIHFHIGKNIASRVLDTTHNKLIVGIFAEHLTI